MILVDNLSRNFQLQKENGIEVRSWFGDPKDSVLMFLGHELEQVAKKEPEDLRTFSFPRSFL